MGFTETVQAITVVGFPIVACIAMAIFIRMLWNDTKNTLAEVTSTNKDLSVTNKMLVENFTREITEVKREVSDIGNKVDIINIKLDK